MFTRSRFVVLALTDLHDLASVRLLDCDAGKIYNTFRILYMDNYRCFDTDKKLEDQVCFEFQDGFGLRISPGSALC